MQEALPAWVRSRGHASAHSWGPITLESGSAVSLLQLNEIRSRNNITDTVGPTLISGSRRWGERAKKSLSAAGSGGSCTDIAFCFSVTMACDR